MNLTQMRYAVEIAKTNSINKAADTLFVGQSALSRAIKELETGLGVTLFERSAKGMYLTADGEVFIQQAKKVLGQVEYMEEMFHEENPRKKTFSVTVPRAAYIADAFAKFSRKLDAGTEVELYYKETNANKTIKMMLQEEYKLGILRYAENYDKYYKAMMEEKGFCYEMVTKFCYVLLMSRENKLAGKKKITFGELKDYIEIAHADPYVPSLPFAEVRKEELPNNSNRRIYVFERASQFELLAQNPETFMWVSPMPQELLDRYGLVQLKVEENKRLYKDVLIHRKEHELTDLDLMFINELVAAKREIMENQLLF